MSPFTLTPASSAGSVEDQSGWVAQTLRRIQSEYQEMPGMCLTATQAARLLGLQAHECNALLNGLVDVGFLRRTSAGYVRA
jgi:DNA-binding IclR family transcriptional regulator